jgi:phosphatidate cytidylyltransferase
LLATRLATAVVGIPLIALSIWLGDGLLAGVVAGAVFIACLEIAAARGALRTPLALSAAALASVLPVAAYAGEDFLLGATAGAVILLSLVFVIAGDPAEGVAAWLWGMADILYFGLLAAQFVLLRELSDGRAWLFFVVLTVWITDTGAYFVGRLVGRHKLAPRISPGKTVEGAIGSAIAGFAAVFALNEIFDLGLALEHRIALGLILPPVIMVGDLSESALKRALAIKDSSGLVPGHGGIADRLDSLLFAVPVVFYYLRWVV